MHWGRKSGLTKQTIVGGVQGMPVPPKFHLQAKAAVEAVAKAACDERGVAGVQVLDRAVGIEIDADIAEAIPPRAEPKIPTGCITGGCRATKGQCRYARQGECPKFHCHPRFKTDRAGAPPTVTSDVELYK